MHYFIIWTGVVIGQNCRLENDPADGVIWNEGDAMFSDCTWSAG